MMWVPRRIEGLLRKRAGQRPVVVLTGARQTGKTSLVRRTFGSYEYVSLDLPSEAEQAECDPASFLARHQSPLIVDEVQYAPGLFRHLKAVVDKHRGANGLFILAGRADILELETFPWLEVRAALSNADVVVERFIRAFSLRTGQLLNRADLVRDVGISASTTAAWLGVLQASRLVVLLEPWFSNRTKSLVKSPKLYLVTRA
jgi:uncharacterized protein